jgi:hypothetical protein
LKPAQANSFTRPYLEKPSPKKKKRRRRNQEENNHMETNGQVHENSDTSQLDKCFQICHLFFPAQSARSGLYV